MNPPAAPTSSWRLPALDPHLVGALCGMVAALAYTASNVCLRAVANCDPVFVSFVKAWPTVLLMVPLMLLRVVRGQGIVASWRTILWLGCAGLVGQLCGNVVFQWALGIVGMGPTVALCFGTMICSASLLGWLVLGEGVTRRMMVACAVLIAAIGVLSLGVSTAQRSEPVKKLAAAQTSNITSIDEAASATSWWLIAAGIAAPCLSGLAYSVLNVTIRHNGQIGTPLTTILALVGLVGLVSLGLLSYWRMGMEQMLATERADLYMMLGAGAWNALAFWALAKALHLTSVVVANGLNASQTAMAALAGVIFFGEMVTFSLVIGTGLTMLGLVLMKGRTRPGEHLAAVPGLTGTSALAVAAEACVAAEETGE